MPGARSVQLLLQRDGSSLPGAPWVHACGEDDDRGLVHAHFAFSCNATVLRCLARRGSTPAARTTIGAPWVHACGEDDERCTHQICNHQKRFPLSRESGHTLWRYVIRPRDRSYGETSTVTRSPSRMRMRNLRSLPAMVARTAAPLSSVTRNDVLGRTSVTVPSSSIRSSLEIRSSEYGLYRF